MSAVHGGDVLGVARAFGRDPASLLDFSANVNPLGPPAGVLTVLRDALAAPALLTAYPDPHARELTAAIAARERIAPERVLVANGGAALLDASVRALGAARCVLPIPAFSEYARALRAAGTAIVPFALGAETGFVLDPDVLVERVRETGSDLCVFANPHNPSGALLAADQVLALVRRLARLGCATIVDEAFVDYVPEASIAGALEAEEPVVVLRSLTKFYAIPGLRVGYAFASRSTAARVRAVLPSWPVGTLEQRAACAALADEEYARRSRAANARARAELAVSLRALRAHVFPAAANFLLIDVGAFAPDAPALREALIARRGIVVRAFADDPALSGVSVIRVAVRGANDNLRLAAAIEEWTATTS
ncbi:MAG TPA: aminotransferase class I/II-fold pyridoxal phosphate-dependent enzyme [Candidatus Limnocylindria bacterium]|nr:aminotransferase class I/II-fold pyridoxal phosphate-dependent enzyme [Candidatus Limnocylindria bacterium]